MARTVAAIALSMMQRLTMAVAAMAVFTARMKVSRRYGMARTAIVRRAMPAMPRGMMA